jgi:hypothetical protein
VVLTKSQESLPGSFAFFAVRHVPAVDVPASDSLYDCIPQRAAAAMIDDYGIDRSLDIPYRFWNSHDNYLLI